MSKGHGERAHSKYSASGAERWFNCPGSVALSEGVADKPSPWALEGTQAHEVLEAIMRCELSGNDGAEIEETSHMLDGRPQEMLNHGGNAARFILDLGERLKAEVQVENRVYLDFIHPEMFGTYDASVAEHFGTLHAFDYKYGAGHAVSPRENLQMIFYGIGLAHKYDWNFQNVRLWIIQPRIKGYDGPTFWDIPTMDLKQKYVPMFEEAVERVEKSPKLYVEGGWCHWCKAKSLCPLKREAKLAEAKSIFGPIEKEPTDGKKESKEKVSQKSAEEKELEAWYKKREKEKARKEKTQAGSDRNRGSGSNASADFF